MVTLVSFNRHPGPSAAASPFNFNGSSYGCGLRWSGWPCCTAWPAAYFTTSARPQIALNFQQQRYEADFRHHLVRVREVQRAIALDRGRKPVGVSTWAAALPAFWRTTCDC